MTPKKAVIIILIMSLAVAATFIFLYINCKTCKPLANQPVDNSLDSASVGGVNKNEPLKPAEINEKKLEEIIKDANSNPQLDTPVKVKQNIMDTYNEEIQKQAQSLTPEQQSSVLKAQEEKQKIMDQFNGQKK